MARQLKIKSRAAAVVVMALGCISSAAGQSASPDAGMLVMRVEVPASTKVLSTASTPSHWRVYEQLNQVRVRFHVTNESRTPLRIDQVGLRKAVELRARNNDIAVDLHWIDEVLVPDQRGPVTIPLDSLILLAPDTALTVTAAIVRVDGRPFTSGIYRFVHSVSNFRAAISTADGVPWSGRVPEGSWELIVGVEPPATVAEQGTRHILEARELQAREDFTAALDAYARAAKAHPADTSGIYGMAHMYRRLQRYREAIPLYEQVLRAEGGDDEQIAFFTALAYLGAGDDSNARRVLRQSGVPEDRIPERIEEMWQRVEEDRENRR